MWLAGCKKIAAKAVSKLYQAHAELYMVMVGTGAMWQEIPALIRAL